MGTRAEEQYRKGLHPLLKEAELDLSAQYTHLHCMKRLKG
jgi:hypothetical protein